VRKTSTSPRRPELPLELLSWDRLAGRDLVLGPPEGGLEPGALVDGEVLERIDPVQAREGIARVPQVLRVSTRSLLLTGGKASTRSWRSLRAV
jgi:hypothetical protein